jgi:hypothetical protein
MNQPTRSVTSTRKDRDHAKLWIATHQLGRRNLTDDQRADIANEVREIRSVIAQTEQRKLAAQQPRNLENKASGSAKSTEPLKKQDTRKAIAAEAKLPERKIRLAQEIKKASPAVSAMVRAGDISLVEGRKIVSLAPDAREIAVKAVQAYFGCCAIQRCHESPCASSPARYCPVVSMWHIS